ncbi:hypothetical protein [Actinoplanes sp. OR16]|uniref:hypothetical protein n=1 Tax=Actinoplanes sp. OR16 TaxID=946334 RepID=UPI000FDC808C|nr:hypothetical protein [Actinoplanes sp. OR16]
MNIRRISMVASFVTALVIGSASAAAASGASPVAAGHGTYAAVAGHSSPDDDPDDKKDWLGMNDRDWCEVRQNVACGLLGVRPGGVTGAITQGLCQKAYEKVCDYQFPSKDKPIKPGYPMSAADWCELGGSIGCNALGTKIGGVKGAGSGGACGQATKTMCGDVFPPEGTDPSATETGYSDRDLCELGGAALCSTYPELYPGEPTGAILSAGCGMATKKLCQNFSPEKPKRKPAPDAPADAAQGTSTGTAITPDEPVTTAGDPSTSMGTLTGTSTADDSGGRKTGYEWQWVCMKFGANALCENSVRKCISYPVFSWMAEYASNPNNTPEKGCPLEKDQPDSAEQ